MAKRYLFVKRHNDLFIYEIAISSILLAVWLVVYYPVHPAIGFLIFVLSAGVQTYFYFASRFFRYLFAILFSLAWAAGAFVLVRHFAHVGYLVATVSAVVALCVSLWMHRKDFRFYKEAEVINYDSIDVL